MAELGSTELFLLLVLGLIVLGPKRLPEIAGKVGGWVGQARRMARMMKRQLEDEVRDDVNSLKAPLEEFKQATAEPNPADPAYDLDEPAHHIPNDDDEYSPIHSEDDGEDDGDSKKA